MANINNVRTSGENVSSSSFLEVSGDVTIKTDATFSSTIRNMLLDEVNDKVLKPNMSAIAEEQEPHYSTADDDFTETCASCLRRDGTRIEATHFCPGCDRRGRYMCLKCLKDHTLWCKGPEHQVESLSVDRHSDPEYRYNTIKQSEQGPPKCPPRNQQVPNSPNQAKEYEYVNSWLNKNSIDCDSEKSEYTIDQSRGSGQNITEHGMASSRRLSLSDDVSLNNEVPTVNHRPQACRNSAPTSEGAYEEVDEYQPRQETVSHIYVDPITMLLTPPGRNPHQRGVRDPSSWDDMSTVTARRLNAVYNNHKKPDLPPELPRVRRNGSMERVHKKNKKCVVQ